MSLKRPCLGCGRLVRGNSRCADCRAIRERLKRARRPERATAAAIARNAAAVADHRATYGDWCPGGPGHPAHPSADLTADHVTEVAAGGPEDGPLVVRCRSYNSARSANLTRKS
jgi:5-methylcytosine-specific restriction enzyme A